MPVYTKDPLDVNGNTAYSVAPACPVSAETSWLIQDLRTDWITGDIISNDYQIITQKINLNAAVADLPANQRQTLRFYEQPDNIDRLGSTDLDSLPMR